jgi:predicted transcriptional regulator
MSKDEIDESKIRIAKWYLKSGHTKKKACEALGITYNVSRLDRIIKEFDERQVRLAELKNKMKNAELSDEIKKSIAKDYMEGKAKSKIAEEYHITSYRVNKVLLELQVPLRGKGRKSETKTTHIQNDTTKKLAVGDKVYYAPGTPIYIDEDGKKHFAHAACYAKIVKVYDESFLDLWSEGAVAEETKWEPWINLESPVFKKHWPEGPVEGQHYKVYYQNVEGEWMDRRLVENEISGILSILSKYGQSGYRIYCMDEAHPGYYFAVRNELFTNV